MYVLAVTVTFTALSAVFVALRLFTRFVLVKSPGLDDLLISIALVINFASTAFILLERNYGLGIPTTELTLEVIANQLYWLWLSIPFYNLTLILAKLSALALYIRLFRVRNFLRITYIVMGFLVISGLWMVVSGFVQCVPIHTFWVPNKEIRRANCLLDIPLWFTNAGIQIATDIIVLVLPMPLLWKLQMPKRQKWGVLFVFGVVIFIVATSAARMYYLSDLVLSEDKTGKNANAAVWSSIEANVSIICVSLPPLHPLLSRMFSFCFRPRPVHPSTTSNPRSQKDQRSKRPQTDGMVWYNELFSPGAATYSASISKVNTNDDEREHVNEHGIRVVRELRMQSDCLSQTSILRSHSAHAQHPDVEKGEGASRSSAVHENPRSDRSFEEDLGDFEFPDYKENMNAPI